MRTIIDSLKLSNLQSSIGFLLERKLWMCVCHWYIVEQYYFVVQKLLFIWFWQFYI